jgi:hypothetical protein
MTFASVLLLLQKVAAIGDGPALYGSRRASGFWTTPCRGKTEPHTARIRVRRGTLGTGAGFDRNDAAPNLDAWLLVAPTLGPLQRV